MTKKGDRLTLPLPRMRPDQSEIINHPARYKFLAMGRRWGKTIMGGSLAQSAAAHGGAVAWVVPTFRNARPVWRMAEAHAAGRAKVNRSEMSIHYPGGGWLGVYTAENPISILGEAFDLVVMDEAARYRPEVWYETIMPTLADRNGRAILISTPVGKNWFYREFMRGLGDMGSEQASFHAPSANNPNPQIQQAAAKARELVSERTYRQEWLAEFVDDGALFVNIDKLATLQPQPFISGHQYSIGVDWARSAGGDYSVFMVVDATDNCVAQMVRLSGLPFDVQLARLKSLWEEYGEPSILAESNSMGAPLIERLQAGGLPVTGFATTAQSKHQIISELELAFDQMQLRLLDDPTLVMELNAFEQKARLGFPAYGAPAGFHDDTVIALALAWHNVTGVHRGARVWAGFLAQKMEQHDRKN